MGIAHAEESGASKLVARALGVFTRVEPEEVLSTVVLTLIVFVLMTAYYFLKTVREPLILLLPSGAEMKSYASAGQAVLLVFLIKGYAEVAKRVPRMRLTATLYFFYVANLVVFAILQRAGVKIGIAFYLWVGVFNTTAISQFWSFANDVYGPEQGKRLFAILGVGGSVGALAGAKLAGEGIAYGVHSLMFAAAVLLVVCVLLFAWVDRMIQRLPERAAKPVEEPITEGVIPLFRRSRYLILIAAMILLLNWVNSTGEYLLDRVLTEAVEQAKARGENTTVLIGSFKAGFFTMVNFIGVMIQLLLVSRIFKYLGLRNALLFLPAVAFCGYFAMLVAPVLALIRVAKIAENSIDYSVQTTARQALYLVADRAEKYIGKTTIDSFVMRSGDVLAASVVWLGVNKLAFSTKSFATLNLVLIVVWVLLVLAIGREHARRSAKMQAPA